MKKSLLWLLVLVLSISMVTVFSLASCKKAEEVVAPAEEEEVVEEEAPVEEEAVEKEVEEEGYTFGFVFGVDDPFYTTMQKGTQEKADELGINVIFQTPEKWAVDVQTPIIESLVARGDIDLLVVVPVDTEAMIPVLKKVYDKGIPIITVDGFLGDGDYSDDKPGSFCLTYIGSDNFDGGLAGGEALAEMVDYKGKAYCEVALAGVKGQEDRLEGFKAGISNYPEMEIVGWNYCDNDPDKAQANTRATLEKDPDMAVIFGCNVFSAQGAAMAVENLGYKGEIKVGAFDATEFAIEKLKEGLFQMVLAQLPGEMGSLAIECGYKYLENSEEPSIRIKTGFEVFTEGNVNDPEMQKYVYKGTSE